MKLIDISHHDGSVNWQEALESGDVDEVYTKATQGANYTDPMFEANRAACVLRGIPHGAYHYVTPTDQAGDQANHFLAVLAGTVGQLAPALDVESTYAAPGGAEEWAQLDMETRVSKICKIGEFISAATGVERLALYASPAFVAEMLGNDSRLAMFDLWVAEYGVSAPHIPAPFTKYLYWQNSESGTVPGVGVGSVDLDVSA